MRNIKRWLRSEPSALPFDEVWQDLVCILRERRSFATLSRKSPFAAAASSDPPAVTVEAGKRTTRVLTDELLDFWQQSRDFGLTHGSIAPDHRFASYPLPVFAELPYVEPVMLSTSSSGLRSNPAAGLQVVPPPMPKEPATEDLFARADLRRKHDADEILEHMQQLPSSLGLDRSRRFWSRWLFRSDHVENAAKILNSSRLLSRAAAERGGLIPVDSGSPQYVGQLSPRHRNLVRLYFRPRTPTQYANEGIRPRGRVQYDAHMPVPVYLLFSASLLALPSPTVVPVVAKPHGLSVGV